MPKVSVILPAYNAEKYIKEAVDSILSQTFGDFELIVINDCSKDSTEQILLSYTDPRLVYVKNEENLGVAGTLNKGLKLAKGQYIARMDADDISLPQRIEKQVAYLDSRENTAVLGTALERFGEGIPLQTRSFSQDPEQMKVDLFFSCGLAHPSIMMRNDVIRALGGYDMAFEGLEDYELWCRVAREHQVTTLPEVLFRYRVHPGQVTKNPSEKYLTRIRNLKKRQLEELGMETGGEMEEIFFRYCLGEQFTDAEDIQSFCAFLKSVLEANQSSECFDPVLLRGVFKAVAVNLAMRLKPSDAVRLRKKYRLFSATDILMKRLKSLIRH